MSNYLIESSVCLACFYAFYWIFLHREKLLSINRFYLIGSVLVSLVIPLLSFEMSWTIFPTDKPTEYNPLTNSALLADENQSGTQGLPFGFIYGLGLIVSFVLLIIKLVVVKRKLGKNFSFTKKHIEIIETEGNEAFSFLNTIYIGKELSQNRLIKDQIIAHELAHIDGKHTFDMLFFEILKCVYWFNPFSYFYSNSVQLQHEFIADNYAMKKSDTRTYQKSLLQFTLSKINHSLLSNFNQHPVQKRLKMIQTINSNIMNKLKPLLALPILAALFIAYACTEEIEPAPIEIMETETEVPIKVDLAPSIEVYESTNLKLDSVSGQVFSYKLKSGALLEVVSAKNIRAFSLHESKPDAKLKLEKKEKDGEIEFEVVEVAQKERLHENN